MSNRALKHFSLAAGLVLALGACNSERTDNWQPVFRGGVSDPIPVTLADQPNNVRREKVQADNSVIFVGGFVLLAIGGMLAAAIAYSLTHRRRALIERNYNPDAPLRDGEGMIFGKVETPDGQPGVLVCVEQVGKEWQNKGNWSHTWTEQSRTTQVRPFFVRTSAGQLIRVEPPQNVKVHDTLSKVKRHNLTQRTRIAEVSHGEEIHVFGMLTGAGGNAPQGAYRDSSQTPVLRAPRMGTMQISSEKPGATAESRMRTHRGWGIFLATWLVFSLTVMHGDYVTLALDGDVVMVTPEATLQWRQWVKPKNQSGYWRYHYEVRGTSQGRVLEDEVGSGLYHQVNAGTVNQIPFLVSNLRPSVQQYGTEPMTNEAPAIFSVIGALLLLLIYPLAIRATRPWYDRPKFNETVGGRLNLAV